MEQRRRGTDPVRERSALPVFCVLSLLLLLVLSACQSARVAEQDRVIEKQSEQISALEQEIQDQARETEKLAATVASLKGQLSEKRLSQSPGRNLPKIKAKSLTPNEDWSEKLTSALTENEIKERLTSTIKEERPAEPEENSDSDAIVDSSHEGMHLYFRAQELLEQRSYDKAIASFREFLKEDPHHVYGDRAEYWIGEAHFKNRDYGLALVAFNLLENRHPYSVMLSQALFRKAQTLEQLGHTAEAKDILRDLLKRYPSDAVAAVASRRLVEMGGGRSSSPPLLDAMKP